MSKGKKVIAVLIAVFLLGIALGVAVFFLYENTRLRNAAEPSPAVENMPEPMPTVEVTPSPEPTP